MDVPDDVLIVTPNKSKLSKSLYVEILILHKFGISKLLVSCLHEVIDQRSKYSIDKIFNIFIIKLRVQMKNRNDIKQ